jgi:hypothetical protein
MFAAIGFRNKDLHSATNEMLPRSITPVEVFTLQQRGIPNFRESVKAENRKELVVLYQPCAPNKKWYLLEIAARLL